MLLQPILLLVIGFTLSSTIITFAQTWTKVRQDTLRIELVETGEIEAVNSTIVSAPYNWWIDMQVIELVPEGEHVDSGAVLVQLDPSALRTQLGTAKTELETHQAELRRLQTEHHARLRELEWQVEMGEYALKLAQVRLEQLQYESAIRKETGRLELLIAEVAKKEATTRLDAQKVIQGAEQKKQELKILEAQGKVNDLQRQVSQLTLRAPIAGLVVHHADWDGNKPQVGGKVRPGRGLIDLPDLSRMRVRIGVNEVDAEKLRPEQKAAVALDAFPAKQFHGRLISLTQIAEIIQEGGQARYFQAVLDIAENDSLLKPGMTAKVTIELGVLPNQRLIPIGCVYEFKGKPVVFTRDSPRTPVPVEIKARNDFWASVGGLKPDTQVSWQAGADHVQPLGFAAYLQRLNPQPETRGAFFTEMEKRGLIFDYAAQRDSTQAIAAAGTKAKTEK